MLHCSDAVNAVASWVKVAIFQQLEIFDSRFVYSFGTSSEHYCTVFVAFPAVCNANFYCWVCPKILPFYGKTLSK